MYFKWVLGVNVERPGSNLTLNFANLADRGRNLNHLLRFLTEKLSSILRQLCLAFISLQKRRKEGNKFWRTLKVDDNADKQLQTVESKEKWKLFLL